MALTVIDHPFVAERVTVLRDAATDRARFRVALADVTAMLLYEACRDLETEDRVVTTPLAPARGRILKVQPVLVPVMRAGLGMLESALRWLPEAEVAFVGLKKNESTFEPVPYLNTTPPSLEGRPAFVLEPMIATGGSAGLTCRYLADAGAGSIHILTVIAASAGVDALGAAPGDPAIVAAALDAKLNDVAFIVPGLGDAGDRQFGDFHRGPLTPLEQGRAAP